MTPQKWTITFAFLCVLTLSGQAYSAERRHPYTSQPRATWVKTMARSLISEACGASSYFRQCYQVNSKTCRSTFKKATRRCLSRLRLPASIDANTNGPKYGYQLGYCAGAGFEKVMKAHKKSTTKCLYRRRQLGEQL